MSKKSGKKSVQNKVPVLSKWYKADDEDVHFERKRLTPKPSHAADGIKEGTVLILLTGRYRGKRVVFLKSLKSGLLLVSGPFKVNGVPLKRVNRAYCIATKTVVDIKGVDVKSVDDAYFKKIEAKKEKKSEGAFF